MAAKIFRINYKSDFILTLNSDAGWMTPFCIKFWTGAPSQAYYVGWDGETYTHCSFDPSEPTKLLVQFDDHHLPIGDLKFQVAYHFTVADFPNDTEDEVINPANITTEIDGETYQVMLDFTGETAPEIQFSLPAYANEAQRIANEEQRIAHEAIRIVNEESRIAAETIRQQNEAQRIAQETARVNEFATLKSQSQAATRDANDAATLANQKAQLAQDKAALADDAATLAIQKAQLAADKAALANDAAQLAADKAALAQQKAEYAQQQGGYAKDQGDYAKDQGDYAKAQGDIAQSDHERAETDHGIAVDDHTQAGNDHTRAEADHGIAVDDHTQAGNDHTRAESDHGIAADDHTQADNDHTRAESDNGIAADDHTQACNDHTRAESDHTRAESDHASVEVYVDSLGAFDISAYHATGGVLAKYADLTAALGTNGANIPDALRKGGMSVKFVQSSDNKYVEYFLTKNEWSIDTNDWEKMNLEEEVSQLGQQVINDAIYESLKIRLDDESSYYESELTNAYLDDGTITRNQYTSNYKIILFRLPAGKYELKTTTAASSGVGAIFGTLSSIDELTPGGTAQVLVSGDGTAQTHEFEFNSETLLAFQSTNGYFFMLGSASSVEEKSVKEKLAELDALASQDSVKIEELENRAKPSLYKDSSESKYDEYILEALLINLPAGDVVLKPFNSGMPAVYMYTDGSGVFARCNILSTTKNGDVLTIKVYASSNADYPIGTVVGYVVLKDVDGFKEISDSGVTAIAERNVLENPSLSPYIVQTINDSEQEKIVIHLPNKLYAVVGDTLQLFFQGIVESINLDDYDIYVQCSKGKTLRRYYSYTPTNDDIGTTTLTIYVKDRKNHILGEASCELKTVASPVSPASNKTFFTFGDSLTQGQWPAEAKRRLVGVSIYDSIQGNGLSNISFYGYMNTTFNGQAVDYFGVGGWSWANYINKGTGGAFRFYVSGVSSLSIGAVYTNNGNSYTIQEINVTEGVGNIRCTTSSNANTPSSSGTLTKTSGEGDATITFSTYDTENANPLWDDENNKMSFIPYVQNCGASTIDAVYVLLTWNGQGAWEEYSANDLTGHIADAKTFARTLHTEYPNAKLFIMGLQMPSETGGNGANYGASGNRIDWYGMKKCAFNYNKALKDLCELNEFSPYCEFIAIAPQFDSLYNMPFVNEPVNTRRTNITEMLGTNALHPSNPGYMQIADAVYRNIVGNFCQGE